MTGLQVKDFTGIFAIVTKIFVFSISSISVVVIGLGKEEIRLIVNRIRMRQE